MARGIWTVLAAVALAFQAEGIPVDTANFVLTSDSPITDSPASTNAAKPGTPPKILSMHITSDVEFRFARTLINSVVENTAKTSQEVSFSVVLPQDAFITGFEMEIDGKKYRAYVKEKEAAKKTYDNAVKQGWGAAHVAYSARESNSFDVSVNIEPEKKVTFVLTYEELLTRSKGLYHNTVTISPGQIITEMSVRMHIKEPRPITKLYMPKFSSEDKVTTVEDDPFTNTANTWTIVASANPIARKTDVSPNETIVEFTPTVQDQEKFANEKGKGLTGKFKVMYDVERDPTGGEVLLKDGYFVHFFAPTNLNILPKHVVFVLDVSGSMQGRKIEQLKDAMKTILASLQSDDYFNVIVFSNTVISWDLDNREKDLETETSRNQGFVFGGPHSKTPKPEPEPQQPDREAVPAYPATKENILKALKRIEETWASGGTNIFGALKQGIKTIEQHRKRLEEDGELKARKSIIMFLTDGEANIGESRPEYIIGGLSELNTAPQAPIYSLTFGEYGNIDFLKKLSVANAGLARIIYEGADADIQLRRFYHDISSPLLSNVKFQYFPKEVDLKSTTKTNYHTYYDGGEIVVAGRTAKEDAKEIGAFVRAELEYKGAEKHYYTKSTIFRPEIRPWMPVICPTPIPKPGLELCEQKPTTSLERAWAYLTVKQLIDEWEAEKSKERKEDKANVKMADVATTASPNTPAVSTEDSPADNSKAKKRALELALKYSFVTKLTSLVVVKPNASEATDAKRIVSDGGAPGLVGGGFGNMAMPMGKRARPAGGQIYMYAVSAMGGAGSFGGAPAAMAVGGGLFGSASTAATGRGFGSAPAGGGLFGGPPATTGGGGLFANAPAAPGRGTLFGSSSAGMGGGGLFGSAPAAPGRGALFGSTSTATTGRGFGSSPAVGGLFGGAPSTTGVGSLFGSAPAAPGGGGLFGSSTAFHPGRGFGSSPGMGGLFGGATAAPAGGSLSGSSSTGTTGRGFGSSPAVGGLFGGAPATTGVGSLFGSAPAAPGGGDLFGSSSTATTGRGFGSSPAMGGLFSGAPAAPAGGSLSGSSSTATTGRGFGSSPAMGGLFGGAPAAPAGGSLFGSSSTVTTGRGFGSSPAVGGLFGGAPATTGGGGLISSAPEAPGGGGLFGSSSTATTGSGFGSSPAMGGLFGGAPAAPGGGSLFGSSSTATTGSGFGSSPAMGGLFGGAPTAPGGGSLFGSSSTATTGRGFGSSPAVGGLFGGAPATTGGSGRFGGAPAALGGGGLVGSAPATPGGNSLFGGSSTATGGGNLFGNAPAAPGGDGLYGHAPATTGGGSLFGNVPVDMGIGGPIVPLRPAPIPSTPASPPKIAFSGDAFDKMTLSDISWVSQYDLTCGTIELNVSGRKKLYNILLPWLKPRFNKAETTPPSCTSPGISSGRCRHISQCTMRVITASVEAYLTYQCHLGNFLAVCCNE